MFETLKKWISKTFGYQEVTEEEVNEGYRQQGLSKNTTNKILHNRQAIAILILIGMIIYIIWGFL